METVYMFLAMAAGHYIGDFGLQSAFMAENKGTSWEINLYHALTASAAIFLAAVLMAVLLAELGKEVHLLPIWTIVLLVVSHFFIDAMKARWKRIKQVWLDQLYHMVILAVVAITL